MNTQPFDVAVIGAGPGGYVAALKAAESGLRTAIIERHPFHGGTCLNWGCIPSKALLATAEMVHRIRDARELGITVGEPTVDWSKVQSRKDRIITKLRGGIKGLLAARGVTSLHGTARLEGPGRVGIDGATRQEITARHIILATGSAPVRLPGWPTDPEIVCTSDESVHWKTLPRKLLIVGGGVIGVEFACLLQPLGVEVHIVEMAPRLLPTMEEALGEELGRVFTKRGIHLHLNAKVADVALADGGARVTIAGQPPAQFDRVLVAVGRSPVTAGLGFEAAGVRLGQRGIVETDARLVTTAPNVWCIGDANGRAPLAHAASAQGVIAVENILGHRREATAPVPGAVYTFPEVAGVGMTTGEARRAGIPLAVGHFPLGHLGKAMAIAETTGFARVLRHRGTGELLGVHLIGAHATEMIAAATTMLHQRATVADLADVVFAHPTVSESIKEAAEDALGAGLHLPPRAVHRIAVSV
jgi:dihydrolipoamide dehydrogenase